MDPSHPHSFEFRDCAFFEDGRYCVCAVNGVRASRKDKRRQMWSWLYLYYVAADTDCWFRIKYAKVLKSAIFRMIADKKTKNVITLHTNGMVSVLDGMNLTLLYSFKNDGRFFMDLALSPS